MKKNFVFDTNVLLHDPDAIFKFADNAVIIPIYVIEEIDQFKKELSERGRNARQVSRHLDAYREKGNLGVGVPLENGGVLRVVFSSDPGSHKILDKRLTDNLILSVALELQQVETQTQTIFVTKDTNLRVRADAMGLKSVNYEDQSVSLDQLYPGAGEITVAADEIESFYQTGQLEIEFVLGAPIASTNRAASGATDHGAAYMRPQGPAGNTLPVLYPNEYLLIRNGNNPNHTVLGRLDAAGRIVRPLAPMKQGIWGIRPRNKEQHFALDALLNDDIQLVTLLGKAGTGKTLLAIAAGLHKATEENVYQRLLVSRPIFPLGRDIGYLPGSVEEKLNPWMQPIFDNIEYLMGISQSDKRAGRSATELMHLNILEIEPLTFIRGRSIPHQYMIVDEAQNLTPHEVKTILTRVGEGTKIVLTGDPYQIDNPYVDSESNGLTYTINRFKGQSIAATVTLSKGERSKLAELASNLL